MQSWISHILLKTRMGRSIDCRSVMKNDASEKRELGSFYKDSLYLLVVQESIDELLLLFLWQLV